MRIIIFKFVFFVFGVLLNTSASGNDALGQIEKLINQKAYNQAYALANKNRNNYEGEPRFDYLYGLAALQTEHYNEAVFALERVTATEPNVIRPRLELARAYLKLKNNGAALREFKQVLAFNPPPVVRQKVNAYIREIKGGGIDARKSVINGSIGLSFGFDDNINFAFDENEIELPIFGNILLNPESVKQESAFAETKLRLNYQKSDSNVFNRFSTATLTHRDYFDNGDFNVSDLAFRTGFTFNKNKYQYQLVLRDRPVFLGGSFYTNTIGLDTALRRGLGLGTVVTASLTLENYTHKIDSLRDRSRAIISAKLDKKAGNNIHQFSAFYGDEFADDDLGEQFSREMAGAGYRIVRNWNRNNKSFLKLNYQQNKHQAPYPIYPDAREDDRISLRIGHERKLSKNLDLLMGVQYTDNSSNQTLYDITRTEAKIGVRYEWD